MAGVLIVTATDRRRGAEVFTTRLGEGLRSRGWVVDTVSLTSSGDERRVDVDLLTDVGSSRPGRLNRRILRALRARVAASEPDVLLANGGATLRYGALATLGSDVPLAYVAIGEPGYWLRSPLSRMMNRWMLGRARLILTVCEATRRQLLELAPSLAGRVHVGYTGIPDEMFETRRGPIEGQLRVVVVGSLSEEKDPRLAIRTVALVPGALLRMVGDGPLRQDLIEEVRALGLEGRIELVGAVDDVLPHLEWGHVLLLTSRTEGLPGAVLEAGAASVPAVAVDVGGVREAVNDGVSGLVVDRADGEEGLASALTRLAGDPALVRHMGVAARLHMKQHFSMDHIVAGYARRLEEVVR